MNDVRKHDWYLYIRVTTLLMAASNFHQENKHWGKYYSMLSLFFFFTRQKPNYRQKLRKIINATSVKHSNVRCTQITYSIVFSTKYVIQYYKWKTVKNLTNNRSRNMEAYNRTRKHSQNVERRKKEERKSATLMKKRQESKHWLA